jgi:hypothetical protein
MEMQTTTHVSDALVSYDLKRQIKIIDLKKSDNAAYLIKTLLEIMNRWGDIEVHVLKRDENHDEKI